MLASSRLILFGLTPTISMSTHFIQKRVHEMHGSIGETAECSWREVRRSPRLPIDVLILPADVPNTLFSRYDRWISRCRSDGKDYRLTPRNNPISPPQSPRNCPPSPPLPTHLSPSPSSSLALRKRTTQTFHMHVEESINDSVSVDRSILGIDHSGAIGNNDLVVAVQR